MSLILAPFRTEHKSSGFTMIELLVSITILTVVAGAILLTLYSGVMVWERAGGHDLRRMEAMIALEGMEKEARNSFPFYGVAFLGTETAVKFAAVLRDAGDDGRGVAFGEIGYSFDSTTHAFSRQARSYPFGSAGGEAARRVIADIESVKISYAEIADKRGDPVVWLDSWDSRGRLPAALRIEFMFRGADGPATLTRTICLPVRSPKEDEAVKHDAM